MKLLDDKDVYFTEINDARKKIADLTHEKINLRAKSWEDASGIKLADAKKDFVRSVVSDIDREISKLEADIEYYYNQLKLIDDKLEYDNE